MSLLASPLAVSITYLLDDIVPTKTSGSRSASTDELVLQLGLQKPECLIKSLPGKRQSEFNVFC